MQTGTIISGGAHAALLSLAFMSGLDFWPTEIAELKVTDVTLVRADVFDTITSAAPMVPITDLSDLELPDTDFTAPVAPVIKYVFTGNEPRFFLCGRSRLFELAAFVQYPRIMLQFLYGILLQ